MPTTLTRTAASSVRGRRYASRPTTTAATTAPATMAMPIARPTIRRTTGSRSGESAGTVGSAMSGAALEKGDPEEQGREGEQRGVDQEQRSQVRLQAEARERRAQEGGHDDAAEETDDPRRKVSAPHVERRIAAGRQHGGTRQRGPSAEPSTVPSKRRGVSLHEMARSLSSRL